MSVGRVIQYYPALSVAENAKKNGVSVATIRHYIKVNDIDRQFDRKLNIIQDCRKYLRKHPNATRNELQRKTGHSLSTIRHYWEYISTEKELTVFNNEKAKKRQLRQFHNFYATHPSVTQDILREESFHSRVLEPFCGGGTMAEVIRQNGYEVEAYDIVDRGYGKVGDFFNEDFPVREFDIITNPPYDENLIAIIKRCLSICKNKVAMLLPIQYLSGKERHSELYVKFPPSRVFIYCERISIAKDGDFEKFSDSGANMTIYAWYVWERGYHGSTELRWIHNAKNEQANDAEEARKTRGGYYTPPHISKFILNWALDGKPNAKVLEPSCGNGAFLEVLKDSPSLSYGSVTALEIDPLEARKASCVNLPNAEVICDDFHHYCLCAENSFDVVVGNPPFIRSHRVKERERVLAEMIMERAHLELSGMSSSWASFVVGSTQLLNKGGRLGYVLPADILHVDYAKPIRKYLLTEFNKVLVMSFRKLPMEGVQQDIVLLLCEKDGSSLHTLGHLEVDNVNCLSDVTLTDSLYGAEQNLGEDDTWVHLTVPENEVNYIENLRHSYDINTLSSYANIEVGITTGADDFFCASLNTVNKYQLSDVAKPLVGRCSQVLGAVFTENDWQANSDKGFRSYLLSFRSTDKESDYIKEGERNDVHMGYKTSIRTPWYIVPSMHTSKVIMTRQSGEFPKLILNEAEAFVSGSFLRVNPHQGVSCEALVASFYNSLTLCSLELCGRKMGGGAISFLPKDVGRGLLPYHERNISVLHTVDSMLRKGQDIFSILDITDKVILGNMGVKEDDIERLHDLLRRLISSRTGKSK